MEDYSYFIDVNVGPDVELHIRRRTILSEPYSLVGIVTLCGEKININKDPSRMQRKATVVNKETMEKFESKTCHECLELWETALIVEE
jgi:hypothetical protein